MNNRVIWPAIVRSTNDPNGQKRVQLEIKELNDGGMLSEFPWADAMDYNAPLPKEGEAVWAMLQDPSKPYGNRLWFGRRISSFDGLEYEPYDSAMRGTSSSIKTPPRPNPAYPDNEDVRILGRNDTELEFGGDLADLSIGKRQEADRSKLNTKNSRLRLRKMKTLGYVFALQADKIMLASYLGRPKPNPNMDDSSLETLFNELYSLPRGEILVEILTILRTAIQTHIHKYHLLPPDPEGDSMVKLKEADFNAVNNKNIRIN